MVTAWLVDVGSLSSCLPGAISRFSIRWQPRPTLHSEKIFPTMIAAMQIVIMLQVRSFSTMAMVILTAPLGLVGVVPMLLPSISPLALTPSWA